MLDRVVSLKRFCLWRRTRRRGQSSAGFSMRRRWLAAALLPLVAAGCVTSPTGRQQFLLVSPEAAIAQSTVAYLETVRQLDAEDKLLDDPELAARVAVVSGRVVAEAVARYPHTANWKWSVALIDDPETINAWCMAGGRMAVYSGLIERLELSDAELAHILGHEVSHAIANHTAERMSIALATQVALLAVAASDADAQTLRGAALAAQLAVTLPNSRAGEIEADFMGMELASRAGYDPAAAASVWEKMEAEGGPRAPQFLSTHPSPANRRDTLAALAEEMRQFQPVRLREPYPVDILTAEQ